MKVHVLELEYNLYNLVPRLIRRRDVVGRVPAVQPGGPGSIHSGVKNFNLCPGIGCVSFVCILTCVVSGGDPDIMLTIHSESHAFVYLLSLLVQRLLLLPRAFEL